MSNEIGKVEVDRIGTLQAGQVIKFDMDDEAEYTIQEIETDLVQAVAQVDEVTVAGTGGDASDGDYSLRVHKGDGTFEEVTYSSVGKTTDEVAAGLATLVNNVVSTPITGTASNDTSGILTLTAQTAGQEFRVDVLTANVLSIANVVVNVEPDSYELVLDDETDFAALNLNGKIVLIKDSAMNAISCAPIEGEEPKSASDLRKETLFIPNDEIYEIEEMSLPMTGNTKLKFIAKSSGSLMNGIKIAIAREADFTSGQQEVFEGILLNDFFETKPSESRREIAVLVSVDGKVVSSYIVSLVPGSKDYRNKSNYIEDIFNKYDDFFYVKDDTAQIAMPASRLFTSSIIELDGTVTAEVDNVLRTSNGSDGTVNHGDIDLAYGNVSDNTIFGNKEELDVDIVIANEQARVAAGRLASERADCIAFIGAKFEDVVGLKSARIVENLIADAMSGDLNRGEVANSFCATFGNYKYQYDKFNDKFRWVSVAGDVAGLRADTNTKLQTWWASAGQILGSVA